MNKTFPERLKRHIEINGPLPLAEFMHWTMADPKQGYYATKKPIGKSGDFITAPEISQMFGELIGVWAISAWEAMGSPSNYNLVEIGPGRGTLMRDLLRASSSKPDFLNAAKISLIETSESLIQIQKETLANHNDIHWLKSVKDLDNVPSIIIANELLDVLPIRQYVKSGMDWLERGVGLNKAGELSWVLTTGKLETSALPENQEQEPDGAVFEISSSREAFIENTAKHISDNEGVALFIDYGHTRTDFGDTFQALKNHEYVDPLEEPATADLTSHVDFEALASTANLAGVQVYPLITQGQFLLDLGLLERAGQLGQAQDEATQKRITQEAERLALPNQMGDLFKVLAFSKEKLNLPPFSEE